MPIPDADKIMAFATPAELACWLEQNHASESELWVKIFRKGSEIPSITWQQLVVESLRWGWIDGIRKSLHEQAYLQRISPRKAGSVWSKRNTEHVEALIRDGRMSEAGMVHVRAAKADGRWSNAYKVSEMQVPEDFLLALDSHPEAKQFYQSLTKTNRLVIAQGLGSAKKAETRQGRFNAFLDKLKLQQKP